MSAYMCSERQLTILAAYAVKHCLEAVPSELRRDLDTDGFEHKRGAHDRAVDRVFAMLVRENLASLAARYPGDEPGDPEVYGPKDTARRETLPAVHIIKLCHHYAYQACEHSGWQDSAARKLIGAIESRAVLHLPGYDDAPWGL
jgi:hypothetical protein